MKEVEGLYEEILAACVPGGASYLTKVDYLTPAAGGHSLVAAPTYKKDGKAAYASGKRFVEGKVRDIVVLDSRPSQANRMEEALLRLMKSEDGVEGWGVLENMPRVEVAYGDDAVYSDLSLPHRFYDVHVRSAHKDPEGGGVAFEEEVEYEDARKASPQSARALLNLSVATLIFGGWDSQGGAAVRGRGQFSSCLVSEIIGILPDCPGDDWDSFVMKRKGGRLDPVSPNYGDKLVEAVMGNGKKASENGLGNIPPSLDGLDGVSIEYAIRTSLLSFATLRRLSFGGGRESDERIRALLASIAICALVYDDDDLCLRANCFLMKNANPDASVWKFDNENHSSISADVAKKMLEYAYKKAHEAGDVDWSEAKTIKLFGNAKLAPGRTGE